MNVSRSEPAAMPEPKADEIRERFLAAMDQHRRGNFQQAEESYRALIGQAPTHAGCIHNLGLILLQRNEFDEATAMFRRALAISPDYDEAHNNLGVALESQGRLDEARLAYQRAIELKPDYVTAYNNLGDVLRKQKRFVDAEAMYRSALRLQPGNLLARVNLANALWSANRASEAEEAFGEALRVAPDDATVHFNLGDFLVHQGRIAEAESAYRRALELAPGHAEIYSELGNVLGFQGRAREAEETLRQALRLDPTHAKTYWRLSAHRRYDSATHEDVSKMLALLLSPNLSEDDAMNLHFALGKIYDEAAEYDKAFSHYEKANRIGRRTTPFDKQRFAELISRIIDVYSAEFFEQRRNYGIASQAPVFIVGMMRSGTSLVEQIVTGHPDVYGAGELSTLHDMVDGLGEKPDAHRPYPECVEDIDAGTVQSLARTYLTRLQRDSGSNVARVTDKMPSNFMNLGFAALMFPNARVIHCRRNSVDTCLSTFFQNVDPANSFSYDLSAIGFYHGQYKRLMEHWRGVLPVKVHEVRYEELVSNMDAEARGLIDFLGLDWDDGCLSFNRNARPVLTSSFWQVRQPVYATSVERWRNYEKYLRPLLNELDMDSGAERE